MPAGVVGCAVGARAALILDHAGDGRGDGPCVDGETRQKIQPLGQVVAKFGAEFERDFAFLPVDLFHRHGRLCAVQDNLGTLALADLGVLWRIAVSAALGILDGKGRADGDKPGQATPCPRTAPRSISTRPRTRPMRRALLRAVELWGAKSNTVIEKLEGVSRLLAAVSQ